jgi:hypothetical protein
MTPERAEERASAAKAPPPAAKAPIEQPRTAEKNTGTSPPISGDMYAYIRQAIQDKRTTQVDVRGFTLSKNTYQDVPAEGAVLIGFQVGLGQFVQNVVIDSFRPIYMTSKGEKKGQWIGKPSPQPVTVKAKAGYVVGAIYIRTGLGIDGFSLKFMKLEKGELKADENYTSKWVGGMGGNLASIGSSGLLAVGICGHINNQGKPSSLGLVATLEP